MKKNLLMRLVFICCAVFMLNCAAQNGVLHDTEGHEIHVVQLKGKWVIVTYWAAWCENCMDEIPELNYFYQTHHDKNIVLLGVNYDQLPLDELKLAMEKIHIEFPVVQEDPADIWPELRDFSAIPVTFIIDPRGRVVKRIFGGNTAKSLDAMIQKIQ